MLSRLSGGLAITSVGPGDVQELERVGAALVDVREQGGWDTGHAPNAEHHPLGGPATSMDRRSKDRTRVVAAGSGTRSAGATEALTKAGLDAVDLTGGLTACQAAGLPILNRRGEKGAVR